MTTVLIVTAAALGWAAVWTAVVSVIGLVFWRPIADRYPAGRWPEEGVALSWQTAYVGLAGYRGVLHVVLTERGLYLRPAAIFRFQHPPMFIPWEAVTEARPALFGGLRLHLDAGRITLGGRAARMTEQALAPLLTARASG